jgi:hypothetical protein
MRAIVAKNPRIQLIAFLMTVIKDPPVASGLSVPGSPPRFCTYVVSQNPSANTRLTLHKGKSKTRR